MSHSAIRTFQSAGEEFETQSVAPARTIIHVESGHLKKRSNLCSLSLFTVSKSPRASLFLHNGSRKSSTRNQRREEVKTIAVPLITSWGLVFSRNDQGHLPTSLPTCVSSGTQCYDTCLTMKKLSVEILFRTVNVVWKIHLESFKIKQMNDELERGCYFDCDRVNCNL